MTALVRTELLKLRVTRTTWVLAVVALALSGLRVALVLRSAGTAAGIDPGTDDAALTLAGAAATGTVVVLFLGVLAVTRERRPSPYGLTPVLSQKWRPWRRAFGCAARRRETGAPTRRPRHVRKRPNLAVKLLASPIPSSHGS